jgi:hypothetical protein
MIQVRPEVTADNRILLEMHIAAETEPDFVEFLKALEDSDLFGDPFMRSRNPPNETEPAYQYQLTVSYDQQL